MFGPATVELGRLRIGEGKFCLAFGIGEALPWSHRKFGPIVGRKLQELRKGAGLHIVILSRNRSCRNGIDRGCRRVATRQEDLLDFVSMIVQRPRFSREGVYESLVSSESVDAPLSAASAC